MKKIILFLALVLVLVAQGRASASENYEKIDQTLDVAFQHARNYPPEFDSEIQKDGLKKDLIDVIAQLEQMLDNSTGRDQILFRLGKASTLAFNLDIPGSREKADKYFTELFILDPDHSEGHLFYGQHLSGRGEFKPAIEHLQMAADGGFDMALNMIGLAYVQMGNKEAAKASFQKFQSKYPDDPQVKVFLDSLEPSGEYEIKPMQK